MSFLVGDIILCKLNVLLQDRHSHRLLISLPTRSRELCLRHLSRSQSPRDVSYVSLNLPFPFLLVSLNPSHPLASPQSPLVCTCAACKRTHSHPSNSTWHKQQSLRKKGTIFVKRNSHVFTSSSPPSSSLSWSNESNCSSPSRRFFHRSFNELKREPDQWTEVPAFAIFKSTTPRYNLSTQFLFHPVENHTEAESAVE